MFWISVKSQLKIKAETLASMANAIGLNYRTIQNQISRNILPDVDTAVKIAQYLNTSVEFLVTGKEVDGYKTKYDNLVQAIKQLPFD